MDPTDGFKGNYLRVPPLLVSTSGLEAYLSRLSTQLYQDMTTLRKRVEECNTKMVNSSDAVSRVKRFLFVNARRGMEECLFGSSDNGNDAEIDHYLNEIISNDTKGADEGASESELLGAMLGIATKLVRNNTKLKAALSESLDATRSFMVIQGNIQQQLQEMREQMQRHKRDFDGLSIWLGTYDPDAKATHMPPSELNAQPTEMDMGCSESFHPSFSPALEKEVDTIFSRSPLLLALRRVVTHELSDRVAHFSELNARDVEGAMEKVKAELGNSPLPKFLIDSLKSEEAQKLAMVLSDYGRRLMNFENRFRQDRTDIEGMRSILYPGTSYSHASSPASLIHMEAKDYFNTRCGDLEERLVFLESEREAFRDMMRALLEWNQHQQALPVELREQLQRYAMAPSGRPSSRSRARLVGPAGGIGVSPNRTMEKIEGKRIFPTEEMLLARGGLDGGNPLDSHRNAATSSLAGGFGTRGCAASLSGSQTTYTRYITDVFNRNDVNRLPPLPYESLLKK